MTRILSLLLGLVFAGAAAAQPDPGIVQKLREGGYVDCASQRNLTDAGREEARRIGAHVKRLGIPIGEVLASPYCRTMETARLAFDRAQATNDVRGGPVRSDDPKRYEPLKKLLSSEVLKGENRVISSHGNPFQAVAGSPYLLEGEVAVVRPEGAMRFSVVARIRPQDWSGLQAAGGRAS